MVFFPNIYVLDTIRHSWWAKDAFFSLFPPIATPGSLRSAIILDFDFLVIDRPHLWRACVTDSVCKALHAPPLFATTANENKMSLHLFLSPSM